ncbi:MAG: SDR family NAD(P)-dependent oxidoreductase [Cyanobacteriota bacterium]|nr:SDR family NAD(P)-dependent oxidoreductase [Cyanobacteriota bacterium]
MRHVAPDIASTNPPAPETLAGWHGTALVVGCGGIGTALLQALGTRAPGLQLAGSRRHGHCSPLPEGVRAVALDLTNDASLAALPQQLADLPPLRLVINTAGLLHDGPLQPEKRLARLNRAHLERSFAVNAFGPVLLAQALDPLIDRAQPFHFASLSARVGSIGDNQLGGWYAYRAAKAAQNQLLRTLAIEWRRRLPLACVGLLHPGTTATALSDPFQAGVPDGKLFSPDRAAGHLVDVIASLTPEQSGSFWAWDGQPIPW